MNSIGIINAFARDLRYAWRGLIRKPVFMAVALLTLSIGIGANTAVFSVLNSVLLNPLPYPKADELIAVWQSAPGAPGLSSVSGDLRLSSSMYFTYAEQNRTFQNLGVWAPSNSTVTELGEPEQVRTILVTDGILDALAVPPFKGRWLSPDDQKPGATPTVMINYGYFQRRFGGDPSVVGRTLTIDSRPSEIVGVMPRGYRVGDVDFDLIIPLAFDRSKATLQGFGFQGIGRLKPGVTIAEADADLARMLPIWMNSWPGLPGVNPHIYESWKITPALRSLKKDVLGNVANSVWVVMETVALVMLTVCANVATLLLVRAETRQQEFAIRAALGAGWLRIVRELLVESVLLALLGGALGLVLASAGLDLLVRIGPRTLPRLAEISIDSRALGFTILLSLLSGLVFGLIPAMKFVGPKITGALRISGRTFTGSRDRHRVRNILTVTQVALALLLLIGSGLMIRTFQRLRAIEPGFAHPEELQLVETTIPSLLIAEPERVIRTENDILDRLGKISGVTSVAFSSAAPLSGTEADWDTVRAEDSSYADNEIPPLRMFKHVSPGTFQTMGTRLMAGRDYRWDDLYEKRPVAIISENLARQMWGAATSAVGKRILIPVPKAPLQEVIGVVEDVHDNSIQEPAPEIVYWPAFGESYYPQGKVNVARTVTFEIRSPRAGTEELLNQVRRAVWSVNGNLPLASVRTMQEAYDRSMARTSFTLVMLGIASAMALTLGIVGIYGVVAYGVSNRRREIAIRLALGAAPLQLKRMFVSEGLKLTLIGAVIGIFGAALLTRVMSSVLFGVSPLDPGAYIVGAVALSLTAASASYLPACRASAIEPMEALNSE